MNYLDFKDNECPQYTEEDLRDLYICNIIDKRNQSGFSDHCREQCCHGRVHLKDNCTSEEFCACHESGQGVKVKCRKLKKKEITEIIKTMELRGEGRERI